MPARKMLEASCFAACSNMNWVWFLFSFKGRFNRAKFWLMIVIICVVSWIMSLVLSLTGLNPMMSEMKKAETACQGITGIQERNDCVAKNIPMFAGMTAAQDKCKGLTDQKEISDCNAQAATQVFTGMWSMMGKMLINMIPVMIVTTWISFAGYVKRFHDLDKSGWMSLLCLIPLVNLFILIWIGFFKGTTGANRFGPDPLTGSVVV